jgi:metal transporter CNNM
MIYGLIVWLLNWLKYFSPQILDSALGHNESALFRRAQLKALVSIHGKEVT